ncbi:ATPase [Roseovarius gahaiensis]|uniref:ATPase n=1 Tax=Roseovarius gahaiensis TaxID=2716691 RepID=A0A967EFN5_9RHOB|nr:ATP12 family protein [Roseovarius gahaiensis]NHQ74011.1 ATPase [Roseovarius gahaiensis]
MSEWKAKRFWKTAKVAETEQGFTVHLDGRTVKTPAKAPLVVPTRAMANAIAQEWDAQEGDIAPYTMPVTRAANAAIDKVTHQHAEVAQMIAGYGDTDLICYRADSPAELVARQAEAWDPLLDWAADILDARLKPVTGIMYSPQDPKALAALAQRVHQMDAYSLTAFHDLVGMSGSLIIGFAALHDLHDIQALWRLSRIDEIWQAELWGVDEEAQEQAAKKESEFLAAKIFYDLAKH